MNPTLLLLVTISCLVLTAQGTNPEVIETCSHTKNPALCESAVCPNGRDVEGYLDANMVLVRQISEGLSLTRSAIEEANHVMREPSNNPHMVQSYRVCLKKYRCSVDAWNGAYADIKANNGSQLRVHLSTVSSNIKTCEDAFTHGHPKGNNTSPLAHVNADISGLACNSLEVGRIVYPGH